MRMPLVTATLCIALAGCAAGPRPSASPFDDLYDGRTELVFGTLEPVASADEALARGRKAEREGNEDLALFEYVRALEKDARNTDALFRIGRIHRGRNNVRQASRAFQLLLDIDPKHAGALENLGLILLENRRYDVARGYLERAAEQDPSRWRVHNGLGVIADLGGRHQEARMAYKAGLHVNPRSPLLLNNLGYSEYLRGNRGEALALYRRALTEQPGYQRAWNNLGLLYATEERYPEAIKALTHVMSEAEADNTVGFICLSERKYDCAEKMFKEAMRRSPHFYVAAKRNLERLELLRTSAPPNARDTKLVR